MSEQIKNIASAICCGYLCGDWARVNVRADKIRYPLVIELAHLNGTFEANAVGAFRDSINYLFCFVDVTKLDFDSEANMAIVERMKAKALEFIKAINESGVYEQVTDNLTYNVLYDKLDKNVTGVSLAVTLHPAKFKCL